MFRNHARRAAYVCALVIAAAASPVGQSPAPRVPLPAVETTTAPAAPRKDPSLDILAWKTAGPAWKVADVRLTRVDDAAAAITVEAGPPRAGAALEMTYDIRGTGDVTMGMSYRPGSGPVASGPVRPAVPPREWIDPATGYRVVRLSEEGGSTSLYFHQNAYTATGDKMVIEVPDGLATVDLKTRAVERIVSGRAGQVVVGRKSRQVFYVRDGSIYATHLDTKATRIIVKNALLRSGSGLAVNADETLLAGSLVEEGAPPAPRGGGLEVRWAAKLPMAIYTIDVASGAMKTVYRSTDWLNHVQFSPTDPGLIMFCHEGPWHYVDRIWTIRTDGTVLTKRHTRQMDMEIAGHEFFSADGHTIWYDLQTPKSEVFWLAGVNLLTGERKKFAVARAHWSVHFNVSPDGTRFAGDGGGPKSVAAPGNGQWIYLFTPGPGGLTATPLVDLSAHDYSLEPNVTFTPDGRWIVFRSNMHGGSHVYAVEIAKMPRT